MGQRTMLWSSAVLASALLAASAPWSQVLPSCSDVPAAQRERARLAGRCSGQAPIVNVKPDTRTPVRGVRRPVPDLRGRRFDARDERLARFVVAVDYRPSPQRRDWVIDQVPRPPATLPEGGDLRIVLSDGALVRVPDVRGEFARALALLYRAGLSWSTADEQAGKVIGQVPAAGMIVRSGTAIALRIAPGPVALAPESTRPEVAPPAAPPPASTTRPPATAPAPVTTPPAATQPAPTQSPGATPPPTSAPRPSPSAPRPTATAMPDLQGMIYDAAVSRLGASRVERVYRAGTEAGGTVIGQSPAAGAPLAPGTTVRLVLSDGTLVRVPRVMSFTLNEARQRLVPGEFRVAMANIASDAPAGTVVSQQPAAGEIAKRGSTIRLSVSSGPATPAAPVAPAQAATIDVPNLVGSTFERARSQLLRFRIERSERAAREPVGTILEQAPPAGTAVEPGSTVSVVVSSGGRPEVIELANVVGQTMDAATGRLSEFRVEREMVPDVAPAGRVLSQEPAPGSPVPPGSAVRLRVSDGSRVVAPTLAPMTLGQARDAARAAGLAIADDVADASPSSRVTAQDPSPGTPIARGSAVRLTVERSVLPFDLPPAAREAWARASALGLQPSPRTFAIIAVILAALLALLLLTRRRSRRRYAPIAMVEPVIAPPPSDSGDATAMRASDEIGAASSTASVPDEDAARPAPPALVRRGARRRVTEPVAPDVAPPPRMPAAIPRAGPGDFRASATLESDPLRTVATNAAPRGPEVRIAARLEAGDAGVREQPGEHAPDELTEETK